MPVAMRPPRIFPVIVVVWLILGGGGSAQPVEPIGYTLRFPSPQTHYVEVEAVVPTDARTTVELMMAVWTPGSYLIREHARHVENLRARSADGEPLAVTTTRKNRWRVRTEGTPAITLSYRVYGREMSVRTNWVDHDLALINGAPTFITLADDDRSRPHDVVLELPRHWTRSVSALPPAPGGGDDRYRAADFDALVDSPIVAGRPVIHPFTVDGVPHALVNLGDPSLWDGEQAVQDVERLVHAHRRFWGALPYERYLVLNLITEAGGGLEHEDSTVLMTSRWQMRDRERYLDWLTLVSHELFHAWNGKRLRPVELGPFDYENEVHTRSLWMTEGLTVYYGALLVHRAGLSTRDEYLAELSRDIRGLQTTPGRLRHPVEQASYDAWIRFYRPHENSRNTTVSYYTKGAVIGFLLDARLRRMSGGDRSLDDALRLAYARHAGERGFTPDELRTTFAETLADPGDLRSWLTEVLETTAELDYTDALDWFGLNLSRPDPEPDDETGPAWLGLGTRGDAGNVVVTRVEPGTPGADAGFNVDDEILGLGGYRVRAAEWSERLRLYRPGERIPVLVSRRGRLMRLDATLGRAPTRAWELSVREVQRPAQVARMNAWLGSGSPP